MKFAPTTAALIISTSLLLAACGGGGGGGNGGSTLPAPIVTTTPAANATVTVGTSPATATLAPISTGLGASVVVPSATTGTGTATATLSSQPSGVPVVSSNNRLAASIGGSLTAIGYVSLVTSATITFTTYPAFTFTLPASGNSANFYLGYYNASAGGWTTLAGPIVVSGTSVSFPAEAGPVTFTAGVAQTFAVFSSAQSLASSAFTCPATGATNSVARTSGAHFGDAGTRRPGKHSGSATGSSATTLLAVSYNRATAAANSSAIATRELAAGARLVRAYDFARANVATRVVAVPTATLAQSEATLRAQSGVQGVSVTGERRFHATSTAFVTQDPYFQGFGAAAPYHETAATPGQWDMYAIGLPNAYGYSQSAGNSVAANPSALGSSSIKIAIIDTGEDASHPELASKIAYQKCFITDDAGSQSTGSFATDYDGHGTDVAGIAAAASNNSLGFTGAGGNSAIYAYRVFPTPDDNCANESSNDEQCSSSTTDIAAAIEDAIAQHVNVISMSLGGGNCDSNGNDSDTTEGNAVKDAINAGIVVVAASGNSGPTPVGVTAPGCDTGVIAVGATSLDDGTPTGTTSYSRSVAGASTANPIEYVAGYSQDGTVNTIRSAASWGIVAPGGDPSDGEIAGTPNDLHWIENIWTSTPFGGQGDVNFAGACSSDFNTTGTTDCRTLIAGTSMATPHVAGAAALILAVNPAYQSSSAMKTLLCQTADNLGDTRQGCGRLNVYTAMAKALNDPSPPTPSP